MRKLDKVDELADYLIDKFNTWYEDQDDKDDFPLPDVNAILVLSLLSGSDRMLKMFTFLTDSEKSLLYRKLQD